MSWQGQRPERPLEAGTSHPTSIAPPGYVDRPSYGSSKAATTPQFVAPAQPSKNADRNVLKIVLLSVFGGLAALFLAGFVIGFLTADRVPGSWDGSEGAEARSQFIEGCTSGAPGRDALCGCMFDQIKTAPEYPTPRDLYNDRAAIKKASEAGNPALLPVAIQRATAACSGRA